MQPNESDSNAMSSPKLHHYHMLITSVLNLLAERDSGHPEIAWNCIQYATWMIIQVIIRVITRAPLVKLIHTFGSCVQTKQAATREAYA